MQIEIKIDDRCSELKVLIITDNITEEVNELINKLSVEQPRTITGFKHGSAEIIQQEKIIRIYSSNQKVYAQTDNGEYIIRLRLYELEERLNKKMFVRISNSEIINLKKVINMDLNLSGTIGMKLSGNIIAYVSRRYVSRIKQVLGV